MLSDWQRPELNGNVPSAGIHLLRELCARHLTTPVVFYHGSSDKRERSTRRELAIREGAFGEAVMPDELLALVIGAVRVPTPILSIFKDQHFSLACRVDSLVLMQGAKGHMHTALKEYSLTADENDGIPIGHGFFLQQIGVWSDYRCRDSMGRVDRGSEAGPERILCG